MSIFHKFRRFLPKTPTLRPRSGVAKVNPLAIVAAIDRLPTRLQPFALAELFTSDHIIALHAHSPAFFPMLAQRWMACTPSPVDVPCPTDVARVGPDALPPLNHSYPQAASSRRAWCAIVRRWGLLPPSLASQFRSRYRPSLDAAAAEVLSAASSPETLLPFLAEDRSAALRCAVLSRFPAFFADRHRDLQTMIESAVAENDLSSIVTAAQGFQKHRSLAPVAAALAAADRLHLRSNTALATWMQSEANVGSGAVRAAMRRESGDHAAARALELVSCPVWQSACLHALLRVPTPIQFAHAADIGHLLENPARAAALRTAFVRLRPQRLLPPSSSRVVSTGAVRWASLVPRGVECLPTAVKLSPLARLVASKHAAPAADETDPIVLHARFVFSSPAGTLHERRSVAGSNPIVDRFSSPHADLDHAIASDRRLHSEHGAAACLRWRTRLRDDRFSAITELRRHCDAAPTESHIALIGLVRRLALVSELSGWLGAVALRSKGDDHRSVATAVAALGDADGPAVRKVLSMLCGHHDSRIRANAVESLGRLIRRGDADATLLVDTKPDPHHRVRANAIRALFSHDAAVERWLFDMLVDDRVSHRIASAWVARRVPLSAVQAPRLSQLALVEPDSRVQHALHNALERILHPHRFAWRSGALSRTDRDPRWPQSHPPLSRPDDSPIFRPRLVA